MSGESLSVFHTAAAVESVAGFTNDLAAHLEPGGYVVSGPDYFLMFRGVPCGAAMEEVLNPWRRWAEEECDCWFIWLAAGDLAKGGEMLVSQFGAKKYLAFQRGGPPKYWRFQSTITWVKAKAAAQIAKQWNSRRRV